MISVRKQKIKQKKNKQKTGVLEKNNFWECDDTVAHSHTTPILRNMNMAFSS